MSVSAKYIVIFGLAVLSTISAVPELTNDSITTENGDEPTLLITGGYRPVAHVLAKHMISIRVGPFYEFFGDNHICGGTIIAPSTVLTAAHCVYDLVKLVPSLLRLYVVAGTPNRLLETQKSQIIEVKRILLHPLFRIESSVADIAVLKLRKLIVEDNETAMRIPYARASTSAGTECTVAGWGRVLEGGPTSADVLYSDVLIWSEYQCNMRYSMVTQGMLCASDPADAEIDACQGDSGGPMFCNNQLVGIVSFGISCGSPDSPGVYTDVYFFRNWIAANASIDLSIDYISLIIIAMSVAFYLLTLAM